MYLDFASVALQYFYFAVSYLRRQFHKKNATTMCRSLEKERLGIVGMHILSKDSRQHLRTLLGTA